MSRLRRGKDNTPPKQVNKRKAMNALQATHGQRAMRMKFVNHPLKTHFRGSDHDPQHRLSCIAVPVKHPSRAGIDRWRSPPHVHDTAHNCSGPRRNTHRCFLATTPATSPSDHRTCWPAMWDQRRTVLRVTWTMHARNAQGASELTCHRMGGQKAAHVTTSNAHCLKQLC